MRSQDVVAVALEAANTELAVVVEESDVTNLRWAGNSQTTNGFIHQQEVHLCALNRSTAGVSVATTSGAVESANDVRALVESAEAAASTGQPDRRGAAIQLPDAGQVADWDEETEAGSPTVLAPLAADLGQTFNRAKIDGVQHYGFAERDLSTTFLGTSAGTRLRHTQISGRLEMTAKSADRTRSAWVGSAEPNMDHIDIPVLEADLRQALAWQGNQVEVAPGKHPVLLSSSAVADLMVELYWSMDAASAMEGRSAFAASDGRTKIGQQLSGRQLNLSSDPQNPLSGMACQPFEVAMTVGDATSPLDNGLSLQPTDWIKDGRLANLVTTRITAAGTELDVTPGIDNLRLAADGHGGLPELAERLGDGILITCLWYNRVVDPRQLLITGLTRDGVYVVKGGEVIGTCGNFRFNDSPLALLDRIVDAGAPERTLAREMGDYFNRAEMPPLAVADFNLSTRSDAQ